MNEHEIEYYSTKEGKIELIKRLRRAINETRKLSRLLDEMHQTIESNRFNKAA